MNKRKKRSEKLGYQWERVKKWLRTFPVPPTRLLLLVILVPLPFLVMHVALKKFKEDRNKKIAAAERLKKKLNAKKAATGVPTVTSATSTLGTAIAAAKTTKGGKKKQEPQKKRRKIEKNPKDGKHEPA